MLLDDATLLERCRQGDDLAWEGLVRRFQGRVYSVACHYMRNAEEARDVAQEVFVRIYERLEAFHGDQAFLPWVLRLSRNICIDTLRRQKARPRATEADVDPTTQLASPARSHRSVSGGILGQSDDGWHTHKISKALVKTGDRGKVSE